MRIKGNRGDSAKVLYDKNVLGSAAKGKEAYHDYLRSLRVLQEAILSSFSTIGTDP